MSAYAITTPTAGSLILGDGTEAAGAVALPAGEIVQVNDVQNVLAQMASDGSVAVTRADGSKVSVPASSLVPSDGPTSPSPSNIPYVVIGAALLVAFLYWNTNR